MTDSHKRILGDAMNKEKSISSDEAKILRDIFNKIHTYHLQKNNNIKIHDQLLHAIDIYNFSLTENNYDSIDGLIEKYKKIHGAE